MVHANCTLYDKEWCRLSQHILVSSIKTKYDHNITEISWKVALNITKGLGLDNSVVLNCVDLECRYRTRLVEDTCYTTELCRPRM
jgi:hypothetical protein